MARTVRIEYAGAVYHVTCWGDGREAIFADDQDRETFLQTLAQMCERTGQRVHSYVLMDNHYHLLLETPEPNLVAGMKWFQGTYTQRHNTRHRLSGRLFQGRYKAVPIDTTVTDFFRLVCEYIHLNPARTRMLAAPLLKLQAYRWSSYPAFVGKSALPPWLERKRVFASVGLKSEDAAARRDYREWLEARTRDVLAGDSDETQGEDEWLALRRGWYLGSDGFRTRLKDRAAAKIAGRKRTSYPKQGSLVRHDVKRAAALLTAGLQVLNLTRAEAKSRKQSDACKQGLAWLVKSHTVAGDDWVRQALRMGHRTNVSRAVGAFAAPHDAQRRKLKKLLLTCTD